MEAWKRLRASERAEKDRALAHSAGKIAQGSLQNIAPRLGEPWQQVVREILKLGKPPLPFRGVKVRGTWTAGGMPRTTNDEDVHKFRESRRPEL